MILEPIHRLPTMVTAVWRRLAVHLFEGRLSLDDMDKIEAAGNLFHKERPGRLVELVVIFPSEARMTVEERLRMAAIVKRWEHVRPASATVVLGNGLVGALQRSVLTGLQLLVPPPHPVKVFGATHQAVSWLTPYVQNLCGNDATEQELIAAVDQLCATFHGTRAR